MFDFLQLYPSYTFAESLELMSVLLLGHSRTLTLIFARSAARDIVRHKDRLSVVCIFSLSDNSSTYWEQFTVILQGKIRVQQQYFSEIASQIICFGECFVAELFPGGLRTCLFHTKLQVANRWSGQRTKYYLIGMESSAGVSWLVLVMVVLQVCKISGRIIFKVALKIISLTPAPPTIYTMLH